MGMQINKLMYQKRSQSFGLGIDVAGSSSAQYLESWNEVMLQLMSLTTVPKRKWS